MKIVIDMNLSPKWDAVLASAGHECVHWSEIGSANAPDREIMAWAPLNGYIVFTHDLDFGAILAATDADSPSVLQVRTLDVSPQSIGPLVISAFEQFVEELASGSLVSVDEKQSRARVLPLTRQD
jgi:predicted nuclease of predicted toxin-antitoxin system